MKKKLELNIYDVNEIKDHAIKYWTAATHKVDEPVVKAHIQAVYDFLNKYGYLNEESETIEFTSSRTIRKKKDE